MNTKALARQFCQSDFLFRFLDRLQIEPAKLALGVAVVSCTALSIELFLAGHQTFLQSVFVVAFQAFVIFPIAILLYFRVPEFLAEPFTAFEETNAVESLDGDLESYKQFREKMILSMSSSVWIVLAALLIAFYWYYRLFTHVPSDPSEFLSANIRIWIRIMLLLIYTPLLYMAVLTLGRIWVGSLCISRFFKSFKITVNPMSPDAAGGFGFVGQMLITSALIATAIGAAASGLVYLNIAMGRNPLTRFEIIILGLIYLTFTPLLFYSFMWSPHRALIRARDDALKPLADEYQRTARQEIPAGKKNLAAIKAKTDHLMEIKRQYELVRGLYPVWPLDTSSLRNLLATSILPAITTLFSGVISNLWKSITEIIHLPKP